MVGNVFMQYFVSILLYIEIGRKKLKSSFLLIYIYGVPGGCRLLWCASKFKKVKVWTKFFRTVPSETLYDKSSLPWLSVKLGDFE